MNIKKAFQCLGFVLLCEAAGIVGSVFTISAIPTWYQTLQKPLFNPPAWLFGPVWTTLYALMGIAAWLIFQKGWNRPEVKNALSFFAVQLVLNTVWSILFFGLHSPGGALVDIVFLWLAILATIISFSKISRPAAWLLAPYIAWASFAMYLNYSIWSLN